MLMKNIGHHIDWVRRFYVEETGPLKPKSEVETHPPIVR